MDKNDDGGLENSTSASASNNGSTDNGQKEVVNKDQNKDIVPNAEQIVHSPMGWGGMRNAPTQPATQGEDTVGDGMNGDVSGTNCEQIVHSPKGWGGKIVTPTQPARANEYLLTVSRT